MKDTVIKGNGKSRIMKAPSNMPSTYEEFRSKALEGKAYFDINVNADLTGSDAGIDVLGMPLNKANLLADDTATGLGLSAESATPDSAFKKVTERLNSADLILAKSKRYATKVIGTSTSGYTKNDVDYLCTGSADQSIINSAISALPSGGGNIILLEGTYNLTGTITMNKANVNLEGVGNNTQLIRKWAGSSTTGIITVSSNNCLITNINCNGLRTTYSGMYNYGLYVTGTCLTLKNTYIFDCYYGVFVGGGSDNTITNIVSCNNGHTGIHVGASSGNNIVNCKCNGNVNGITAFNSRHNSIANNICMNNNAGIKLETSSSSHNSSCNTVANNICTNNESYGIYLTGSANYPTTDNTITGNVCSNNSDRGIYLYAYALRTAISGNTITSNANYGVYTSNNSDDNLIVSNVILNNGTNISNNSTSTVVQNNKS